MDFHVTQSDAATRRTDLIAAGRAVGLPADFVNTATYEPGGRSELARYLGDHGIEFFSIVEVVTPNHPAKARRAGFTELVPPMHLWPWSLLVLRLGDEMRRAVARPVRLRNLYRPQPYNELVASSGIESDHPNACAGDFDFRSESDRRIAEQVIRDRAANDPELGISLGLGARSLHVGVLSPKGPRHWFYDSYRDPRRPLVHGRPEDSEPGPDPGPDPDPTMGPGGTGPTAEADPIDESHAPGEPASTERRRPLDESVRLRLIEQVAVRESGGDFGATNADGEFEGRFDRPGRPHPASGRYHIGLSFGLVQFTQDSGTLGELLDEMKRRDPVVFRERFGPSADALVALTNRPGPASKDSPPRGPRVQQLDGADLWEPVWLRRFEAAARHRPFQEAQLEMAARIYLLPMLSFARWLGLDTDRALGMVFDRAVQMGRGGARRWIMTQIGPIQSAEMLRDVLAAYDFATVRDFQRTVDELAADGDFGPQTHAALCFHERQRPDSAPFVMHVPDRETMLDMLVAGAHGHRWSSRVERLRTTQDFGDVPLDL